MRLVNSTERGEGRVEICFNNTYGSVCGDFWDELDARVVCGQLGFMRNGGSSLDILSSSRRLHDLPLQDHIPLDMVKLV